jgi:hypothetical protein
MMSQMTNIHIENTQDIEEIIKANKVAQNEGAYKSKPLADAKGYRVARLPNIIVHQLAKKGILFHSGKVLDKPNFLNGLMIMITDTLEFTQEDYNGTYNFLTLKTTIANYLNRTDLTAHIGDFITLTESRFNRELRVREMVNSDTSTTTVSGTQAIQFAKWFFRSKFSYFSK